ncbi:EF-hand domain-containing protein [Corallincola platygyrae]|uniref:EF-hand domain-containing protein n=1 Tax=Corallincola platygyrae TaxID=1193278 RepID=A0ABW4XFW5_9GAMM
MNISGSGTINPYQFQQQMEEHKQQMDDAFSAADIDGSSGVTIEEMTEVLSERGVEFDTDKLSHHFEKMDTNGDGEVSTEERQALLDSMKEQMAGMPPGGAMPPPSGGQETDDSGSLFESLLQSLSEDQEEGSDAQQDLTDLLEKLKSEGYTEDNVNQAIGYIQELIPTISTTA